MTLKKVQSGDKLKIPAKAYNSFVDAAEAHKSNMFKQSPGKDTPGDNLVLVKNNSEDDVLTGGVLGIDGPIFGPDDNLMNLSTISHSRVLPRQSKTMPVSLWWPLNQSQQVRSAGLIYREFARRW